MLSRYILTAPCHFGTEAVLKREITDLGYDVSRVEDGKVSFIGDEQAIADANVFLRTPERILLEVGRFRAETFDELFENTKALPWEGLIPKDGRFWVAKATSVRSRLFSPTDIQSIVKKAIVERLKEIYHTEWFEESGERYPIRVTIIKDEAVVALDTSGISLHRRGYRKNTVKAPLTETLAAALLMLTPWRKNRILVDPFCGSGTFPIEAAMMAAGIAPGAGRSFQAEQWAHLIPESCWRSSREEAAERENRDITVEIQGYDIDASAVKASCENARRAGVDHLIRFRQQPVSELNHTGEYGFVIANPPYGERLEEKESLPELYREIGAAYRRLNCWSMYLITSYDEAERYIGRKADRNRKLYNGMIRTYFYQFMGPKPPGRKRGAGW